MVMFVEMLKDLGYSKDEIESSIEFNRNNGDTLEKDFTDFVERNPFLKNELNKKSESVEAELVGVNLKRFDNIANL